MLKNINPQNILFLDIETVPAYSNFEEVPSNFQILWEKKTEYQREKDNINPDTFYKRAGIYAEFGKIICISTGILVKKEEKWNIRLKSFYNYDEKQLLLDFADLLNKHFFKPEQLLCGHNAKEFDFPYIARRMLINGITIPNKLNLSGKKPWEVPHLDTMELWKFGDYKNFTSLNLLAAVFNIPTPKDDIDGSMVYKVYWEEKNIERIVTYCQKDVLTVAQLFLKFKGESEIKQEEVVILANGTNNK